MGGTPWAGMAERRPSWGAVDAVGKSGIAPLKKHPASELLLEGIFKPGHTMPDELADQGPHTRAT